MTPSEREIRLRQHFLVTNHIARLIEINSSIAHGIVNDNPPQVSFQSIKMEQETKELLEYVQELATRWNVHLLDNKTEDK